MFFAPSKAKIKQSIINKLKLCVIRFGTNNYLMIKENGNAGNKLKTYRTFKTNIKLEKYIQILDQKQRQILCKFRISSHHLYIEKGRYYQMEPEKRICKLCYVEVEDEMHFLLNINSL